ncbi:protein-glutamate methylesterase/protein-glutamine glutaminase [Pseudemcibacter aquimaris]|uniref:protein-glutamate methylesterase/protein-glutamine glutaminase n=1 Tax=Pseudemcibacter aquimaris TaxID=2857064 RepID=UPI002013B429|nr:chemotaxis response regulator protein-glutamate methylesterase [Pseudemcibacter aquimaris]MCC3862211.1 chemotaxis response regulator protein-glutamate methylesterase [Pseudemcibacter aquimaris]WDU58964.1 chemotaxis response regulator protein-glutamate methylesterase [Pseudemcibacter aquimaris]
MNRKSSARSGPYKVMLVDDSSVIRGLLSRWLGADPAIEIVASVGNGQVALNSLERTDPEIVVLDIEMPVMDGLTALPLILKAKPDVQVLMSSTLTAKNAKVSLQAMSLGAADYIPKPTTNREVITSRSFQTEIIEKVKNLAASKRKLLGYRPFKEETDAKSAPEQDVAKPAPVSKPKTLVTRKASLTAPRIIGVGSSTGGPQALLKFLNGIKDGLNLPVVITQHMPSSFTKILAGHLSKATGLDCIEAEDKTLLENGKVYIAPGDHHMVIKNDGGNRYLRLNQDPPENFCRPAVDPMFRSISDEFGSGSLCVILTGMGQDGLKGSKYVVDNGGTIVAQDQETSVVWGMPGAVSEAGICHAILPLDEIGGKIQRLVKGR